MPTTYQRCPDYVNEIAAGILLEFNTHGPLVQTKVTIDYVFAFPALDENGVPQGDALTKNGFKCLGLCRIIPLKDRALGRCDAEISIDGNWWEQASDEERAALLDHELHHISVREKDGVLLTDDLRRPLLKLRKHDVEIGWFDVIAARHGAASLERIQAKKIVDEHGQFYWPEMCGEPKKEMAFPTATGAARNFVKSIKNSGLKSVTITGAGKSITIAGGGKEDKAA